MGKAKKLSAEEEEARRQEEVKAVHDAYLMIFREAHANRGRAKDGPQAVVSVPCAFPVPAQPCHTALLPKSFEAPGVLGNLRTRAASLKVLQHTRSPGKRPGDSSVAPAHITLCGTAAEASSAAASQLRRLRVLWEQKGCCPLAELCDNLVMPVPDRDMRGVLADISEGLLDRCNDEYPNLTSLEVLVAALYTMEPPDIDRLLGWPDAPPPYNESCDATVQAWINYTAHNVSLRSVIAEACTSLDADPQCPVAVNATTKWIKTLFILLGCAEGALKFPIVMSVGPEAAQGISAGCGRLVAPSEATANPEVAEARGVAQAVVVGEGFNLAHLSQYPTEDEWLLLPGSVVEEGVDAAGRQQMEVARSCSDADFNDVLCMAIAEARVTGQWLTQLAGFRYGCDEENETLDDDVFPDLLPEAATSTLGEATLKAIHALCARPPARPALFPATEMDPSAAPTPSGIHYLCEYIRTDYAARPDGALLTELARNLVGPHPNGSVEHVLDTAQRLAVAAVALADAGRESGAKVTPTEALSLWLTTAHGVHIDELMGFDVPQESDADAWSAYVAKHETCTASPARNGCVWARLCNAVRAELTGKNTRRTRELIASWRCLLAVVFGVLEGREPDHPTEAFAVVPPAGSTAAFVSAVAAAAGGGDAVQTATLPHHLHAHGTLEAALQHAGDAEGDTVVLVSKGTAARMGGAGYTHLLQLGVYAVEGITAGAQGGRNVLSVALSEKDADTIPKKLQPVVHHIAADVLHSDFLLTSAAKAANEGKEQVRTEAARAEVAHTLACLTDLEAFLKLKGEVHPVCCHAATLLARLVDPASQLDVPSSFADAAKPLIDLGAAGVRTALQRWVDALQDTKPLPEAKEMRRALGTFSRLPDSTIASIRSHAPAAEGVVRLLHAACTHVVCSIADSA